MKKLISLIGVMAILAVLALAIIPATGVLADSSTLYWVPAAPTQISQTSVGDFLNVDEDDFVGVGESFLGIIPQNDVVTSIQIYMEKSGSPTGTVSVGVYDHSSHSLLGTLGSLNVSTISTSASFVTFNATPVSVGTSSNVDILVEFNGGSPSNKIYVGSANANDYSGGTLMGFDGVFWTPYNSDDLSFQNLSYSTSSGNWSAATNWSTSSGGAPNHAAPTSSNPVVFNASSFLSPQQVVTVGSGSYCDGMTWTGAANTPTLAFTSNSLTVYGGSLTLISGMNITGLTGNSTVGFIFNNTSALAITTGGQNLGNISVGGPITFNDTTLLSGILYEVGDSSTQITTNNQIVMVDQTTNITNVGSVTLLSNLIGIGSYPVSVYFNYGPTASYGSATTAVNETKAGTYETAVTGLTASTTYHYQLVATSNSVVYHSTDLTFSTPAADNPPSSLTPAMQSQAFDLPVSDAELISGGYAYFDGRAFGTIYQVSLSDFSNVTTFTLPNNDWTEDAMTVCNGQLWVGGAAHSDVYEISLPVMTLTNTIQLSGDEFAAAACSDGTSVYFGGVNGPDLAAINATTLAVTYGTVPINFGSTGMVHELAVDSTSLYGDTDQGGEMFKCNKTTLSTFTTVAGSGNSTDSEELLIDPTGTFLYNLTESTTAVIKQWTTANLTESTCTITDCQTPGLDGLVILPDGSLLVSDRQSISGINYLYHVSASFTYTAGHYVTVSGVSVVQYYNNKIYLSGDNLYFMGGEATTVAMTGIYVLPLGDIYESSPTISTVSSVGFYGATISGSVDTGNVPATIKIYYGTVNGGTTPGNWQNAVSPASPSQPQQTGTFTLTLTGLPKVTTYYYAVSSTTPLGTVWTAASQSFTTTSMVGNFTLMVLLLQVCPAIIFLLGLFGCGFFVFRLSKNKGNQWVNLTLIIVSVLSLVCFLAIMPAIVNAFYQLLTT